MNSILDAPFSEGEITKALFSMKPNKSPGVDGFTSGFFQKHWDLLKHDVVSAVLGFLNGGRMPHDINKTLIVLIPKVKHPQFFSQYRPISLCNVLYKMCSKVLANRLKIILQDIIGEEQSAFVPGRLISDNVLTAYECIHYLKRKKGKLGACAIKIDMAKAYDRVEWQYLESMMIALGFSEAWTQRIMECVRTVSFSIRVNGEFSNFFRPSRGIRQGDPISPYLFLLCADGFSSLLNNLGPRHLARGIRVGVHAPWVSHLLFADDCILFSEATKKGADRIQKAIEDYNRASGQLVNKQKSSVFFSLNTNEEVKMEVLNSLGIENEALGAKYLGLPTAVGRSTKEAFEYIPERVHALVSGWCEKNLNAAGRDVFLKSVAQAIPAYSMSCFKLSPAICKKITSSISNYYWGGCPEKRKMH
jgi:hypothetical protein